MGEDVTAAELGGHKVHERNGVCHFVAEDDADAALLVRDLLDHLPAARRRARRRAGAPPSPPGYDPGDAVPGRRAHGLRRARRRPRRSSTAAACSSIAPRWARNIVCGFAPPRRPRRSASSPTSRATSAACSTPSRRRRPRASCAPATRSACRSSCSSTRPASCPAPSRSSGGVIRHGAKLVHAFAEADRAEGDRRAAQGVRRRVHRHELARPRRRLRVRLAAARSSA